jgi:hypothetical protein
MTLSLTVPEHWRSVECNEHWPRRFRLEEDSMKPNRIVAVLTPLVFAPLAGAIATWVAENFPGVEVSQSALEEIFIAGALIALAPAAQWLHGWQKFEAREAEAENAVRLAAAGAVPEVVPEPLPVESEEAVDFAELEELAELSEDLDGELEGLDEEALLADGEPATS